MFMYRNKNNRSTNENSSRVEGSKVPKSVLFVFTQTLKIIILCNFHKSIIISVPEYTPHLGVMLSTLSEGQDLLVPYQLRLKEELNN
jgi:hypothetical protein